MKRAALAALVMTAALSGAGCDEGTSHEVFSSALRGSNEVPPTGTGADGMAGFELVGGTVFYSLEVNNVENVTQSHIHSGNASVNGPVRVFLFPGPTTSLRAGILAHGSFTAADVTGISFEALLAEMRAGNAYVNVHTSRVPSGELRGQIVRVAGD